MSVALQIEKQARSCIDRYFEDEKGFTLTDYYYDSNDVYKPSDYTRADHQAVFFHKDKDLAIAFSVVYYSLVTFHIPMIHGKIIHGQDVIPYQHEDKYPNIMEFGGNWCNKFVRVNRKQWLNAEQKPHRDNGPAEYEKNLNGSITEKYFVNGERIGQDLHIYNKIDLYNYIKSKKT